MDKYVKDATYEAENLRGGKYSLDISDYLELQKEAKALAKKNPQDPRKESIDVKPLSSIDLEDYLLKDIYAYHEGEEEEGEEAGKDE